jgi:hypothetical protein
MTRYFCRVIEKLLASPKSRLDPVARKPSQRKDPNRLTLWIAAEPSPRASGSLRWPLPDRSPSSSLSSFLPNRHGPCSFGNKVPATTQLRLVWSHKTTSPSMYNNGACKHLISKSYANLTNTRPKTRASTFSGDLTSLSTS